MKNDKKIYYFAYGSNMSHQEMQEWCPGSKFIKRVILKGYKLVYDGHSKNRAGAVANIIISSNSDVYGGLFEINSEDLSSLDRKEGCPNFYDRMKIDVKNGENNTYEAIFYFREGEIKDKPNPLYQKIVIQGAKDCSLPDNYIMDNL
jgi:gamma-glutamylcyclotransferase